MSYKQYQLFLITGIVAIAMLFAAWTAHSRIQNRLEQNVGESLITVLNTTHQAVISWASQEQAIVETWSDNLNIRQAAKELLALRPEQVSLLASPAQQALREQLLPILMVKGYGGYFIINKNNINLASSRDVNIGIKSLLADETVFLDRIWSGFSAMSQPVTSDIDVFGQDGVTHQVSRSMIVGAPILNNRYEVVAAFVFRIDPHRDFTAILQQGRVGGSGETYAFNPNAEMISLSRFDGPLHQMGFIFGDDHDPSYRIKIRDPGANLMAGEVSPVPLSEQPLTLMAQQALAKRDGINLKGYRDYRGVMVLGAWVWDEQLQMGFATEIDADEANETARFTGYVIGLFSVTLTLLLLVLMTVFMRSRQRLAQQSQELRTIIDGTPVAMVVTDEVGNIEFFNRRFIKNYGWTTDDVCSPEQWWQATYPDPEYRQQVQREWEQAVAVAQQNNEAIAPQHWSLTCKTGLTRDVEFRMVPVSERVNVIAMVDLTERNRALRIIQYERDRAQSYLDTVDVMILALDRAGIIIEINKAGCELLGYDEEELIGRNWFNTCIPSEQRQALMEGVHAPSIAVDDEHMVYVENEVLTRSGERCLIAWHNAQLKDGEGNIVGSLSAGSDITDVRRAENERAQLIEQLQQVQKAEAIGQLSAGVSHNFNNMFASIIGFIGLAQRKAEAGEDPDMKRYLSEAMENSYRARDLVTQIASFSRKNAADRREQRLDELVFKSMELLHNILPPEIEMNVSFAESLPAVNVDKEQFQQVIANLVTNASEAMDGAGTVEISGYVESNIENTCDSCHEPYAGDYVVLQIRDSGRGMDEQTSRRMFEPFFSTMDMSQRTGMGLPVVHGIIHNHHGHIQVESAPGAGTQVSLYLPVTTVATA